MSEETRRIRSSKGGEARATILSPEERQEIARQAANARWNPPVYTESKTLLKATHTGELTIGDLILPCAVLEDGTRVLSHRGMASVLGGSIGGRVPRPRLSNPDNDVGRLPRFIAASNLQPFISPSMRLSLARPIEYRAGHGGRTAYGVAASLLPEICEVWLKARDKGVLLPSQAPIVERAEILIRGLAHVGIIALVDEATGYQELRSRQALEAILERYISKELFPWTKMFPDAFYKEMFRLRGWQYSPFSVARPSYVGTLTNDIVYARLAPGVLAELRRLIPKDSKGRRKHKFFQRLTEDVGDPRLRAHLEATTALMRICNDKDWAAFHRHLQKAYPKVNTNLELDFESKPRLDQS